MAVAKEDVRGGKRDAIEDGLLDTVDDDVLADGKGDARPGVAVADDGAFASCVGEPLGGNKLLICAGGAPAAGTRGGGRRLAAEPPPVGPDPGGHNPAGCAIASRH